MPAWRWDRSPTRVKPGTDIDLSLYPGPIMIVHGSTDELWSVEDGPDHLRRTLTRRGLQSRYEVIPKLERPIAPWPALPPDRIQFYIFEGEPHGFSLPAVIARRNLMLAFLERTLYRHLHLRKSSPLSRLQREMLATVVNGKVGGAP